MYAWRVEWMLTQFVDLGRPSTINCIFKVWWNHFVVFVTGASVGVTSSLLTYCIFYRSLSILSMFVSLLELLSSSQHMQLNVFPCAFGATFIAGVYDMWSVKFTSLH